MYSLKIEAYEEGRDLVLLELDEEKIRAYFAYWNGGVDSLPGDRREFWKMIHQARTVVSTLPREVRRQSKNWLLAHGVAPLDRGEL